MKPCTMLRLLSLLVGLLLSAGMQPALADPPLLPDPSGHWSGILQSTLEPGRVSLLDVIVESNLTPFEGRSKQYEAKATLQASAFVHEIGHVIVLPHHDTWTLHAHFNAASEGDPDLMSIEFQGNITDLGGRNLGVQASYVIGPPGRTTDAGTLICVQSLGGEAWSDLLAPDVTGCWMGSFLHGNATIAMSALFSSEVGSSLMGDLTIGQDYAFVGTISTNGSIHGMALGPVPTVQHIEIFAQFSPAAGPAAASISGTLRFVYVGGATEDVSFSLRPCSFEDF